MLQCTCNFLIYPHDEEDGYRLWRNFTEDCRYLEESLVPEGAEKKVRPTFSFETIQNHDAGHKVLQRGIWVSTYVQVYIKRQAVLEVTSSPFKVRVNAGYLRYGASRVFRMNVFRFISCNVEYNENSIKNLEMKQRDLTFFNCCMAKDIFP